MTPCFFFFCDLKLNSEAAEERGEEQIEEGDDASKESSHDEL